MRKIRVWLRQLFDFRCEHMFSNISTMGWVNERKFFQTCIDFLNTIYFSTYIGFLQIRLTIGHTTCTVFHAVG